MENERTFWRRYGGQAALLAMALLLLLGSQVGRIGLFSKPADGAATAVTIPPTPLPQPAQETGTTPDTAVAQANISLASLPVVSDDSLSPLPNPHTYTAKPPSHHFQIHVVTDNDTPGTIAERYGISTDTLIGGNPDLNREANLLQTGTELIILPVDGVLHTVKPGDTLESIADLYDVPVEDIINYEPNNLEYPFFRLIPGTQLVIPGASIGQFYFKAPKSVGNNSGGEQKWAVVGTGTFIWPVNGRCITQFYHSFHPAIDIGIAEGSPVYASDTGTVTYASYAAGVYYDYGNLIVINHGNGYETFYAHLSGINVYPGQIVNQGDLIGATGNTGRSTGPHIHFEIRLNDFRMNPLDRLSGPVKSCN